MILTELNTLLDGLGIPVETGIFSGVPPNEYVVITPLTEDVVELLTSPSDLAGYKAAITEAMFKGTARNVVSEGDDSKNETAE